MQAHLALEQTPLFINVGVAELPHPFKTEDGVGMNHRGKVSYLRSTSVVFLIAQLWFFCNIRHAKTSVHTSFR